MFQSLVTSTPPLASRYDQLRLFSSSMCGKVPSAYVCLYFWGIRGIRDRKSHLVTLIRLLPAIGGKMVLSPDVW
ncbi:hypothetical protein K449DRAFT_138201 [Hypoxylon sp. EC38]|nr:hypothetical protein K449DRAFT_138201 [Hypoxylon sp. EC38]